MVCQLLMYPLSIHFIVTSIVPKYLIFKSPTITLIRYFNWWSEC